MSGIACASIPIIANDEFFPDACKCINIKPQEALTQSYGFQLEARNAKIGKLIDPIHGQSMDKFYSVDSLSYIDFFNTHLLAGNTKKIFIYSIDIQVGNAGIMAEAPCFFVRIKGRHINGRDFDLEKGATGPSYHDWSLHTDKNPKAVRSANVACLAAFIRVLLEIDKDANPASPAAHASTFKLP